MIINFSPQINDQEHENSTEGYAKYDYTTKSQLKRTYHRNRATEWDFSVTYIKKKINYTQG